MPDVFPLPAKCPPDVEESVRCSFRAMWTDPRGAANHIRISLEQLLDHLGVQRRKKRSDGKFMVLSLHARIDVFAKSNPVVRGHLMALKWVGNSGSHGKEVSLGDILDAYDVLEDVLQELVGQRNKRVAELAKKMTQRHGRRR